MMTLEKKAHEIAGESAGKPIEKINKHFWKSIEDVNKSDSMTLEQKLDFVIGLWFMSDDIKALQVGREMLEVANEAHKQEHIANVITHYQNYKQTHNVDNFDMMLSEVENMIKTCESDCESADVKNAMKIKVKQMYDRLNSY